MQFVISCYWLQSWVYLVKGYVPNSFPTPCLWNKLPGILWCCCRPCCPGEPLSLTSLPNPRCSPSPPCFSERTIGWKLPFLCVSPHIPETTGLLLIRCLLLPSKKLRNSQRKNMCWILIQGTVQDTWMISSAPSWGSQGWHPATDLRSGTRGLRMIHTANSLLSNSLCTFPVQQSVNHYAPPLCPVRTGCESVSAPSLIAFLYSTINKNLLLAALEITNLLPASSQKGGTRIHRCPTSDWTEARGIFSIWR